MEKTGAAGAGGTGNQSVSQTGSGRGRTPVPSDVVANPGTNLIHEHMASMRKRSPRPAAGSQHSVFSGQFLGVVGRPPPPGNLIRQCGVTPLMYQYGEPVIRSTREAGAWARPAIPDAAKKTVSARPVEATFLAFCPIPIWQSFLL